MPLSSNSFADPKESNLKRSAESIHAYFADIDQGAFALVWTGSNSILDPEVGYDIFFLPRFAREDLSGFHGKTGQDGVICIK